MARKTFSRILKVTSIVAAGAVLQVIRLTKVAEELANEADVYIHQSYLARHTWSGEKEERSDIQIVWNGLVYDLNIGDNVLSVHVSVNMFDLGIISIEIKDVQGQYDFIQL